MQTEAEARAMGNYKANQGKRGLSRLTIWIPTEDKENIMKYIKRKRAAFKLKQKS